MLRHAGSFCTPQAELRRTRTPYLRSGPEFFLARRGSSSMALPPPRISILDRANARDGFPAADALNRVLERAQWAEELGYHRFWVAEHHAVPGIAGSVPAVLMAAVAARTHSIRVGSGGIMLPNHQPLVVAEQAATLEALHPGRIDLGVGRSVGFTPPSLPGRGTTRRHRYSCWPRDRESISQPVPAWQWCWAGQPCSGQIRTADSPRWKGIAHSSVHHSGSNGPSSWFPPM